MSIRFKTSSPFSWDSSFPGFAMMFFDNPSDNALFASIGRLTISWALLEGAVDLCVIYFFRNAGNPAGEKEMPRTALKRKVTFLKRTIRELPLLDASAKSNATAILDAILSEAVTRQDIIHGAVIDHEEGSGVATLARLIHDEKTGISGSITEITPTAINMATIRVRELTSVMQRLAYELQILPLPTDE